MARGDGRLSHDLLPGEKGPQDACGVFGVWAPGEEVAKLTYFGLYALQHRGQESAGIATGDGSKVLVYKDMGLVSQVFDEASLQSLRGHVAIGHCRYSTTGGSTWENAQPTLGGTDTTTVALAHNGNLINSAELREHALVIGEVVLTSGATAQYYVDAKRAILRPARPSLPFAPVATATKARGWRHSPRSQASRKPINSRRSMSSSPAHGPIRS